MQPILKQLNPTGSVQFYTAKWLTVLENHIPYLKEHQRTERKEIPRDIQSRFMGDPISMFNHLKISLHMHQVIMRCNGWQKNEDFNQHFAFLYVPDEETVDRLRRVSGITT